MRIKNILILADDSEPSRGAVKIGYDLAADLNAHVFLMCVIDKSLAMGDVDAGIFPGDALRRLKAQTQKMLNGLQKEFGKGIKTKTLLPAGNMNESVAHMINEVKADLAVVGTHGRTGLDRLVKGSVAEHIVRTSSIPILVVPLK